jgi:hypothetical protein
MALLVKPAPVSLLITLAPCTVQVVELGRDADVALSSSLSAAERRKPGGTGTGSGYSTGNTSIKVPE